MAWGNKEPALPPLTRPTHLEHPDSNTGQFPLKHSAMGPCLSHEITSC